MDIISIASASIAIIAAIISIWSLYEQRRVSKLNANIAFLNVGHNQLLNNPSLLELHNIGSSDLEECMLTADEFVYILNSFYAGQGYYFIEKTKNIHLSEYRRNLLRNAKVKMAWIKLIRNKMFAESSYSKAIDHFYDLKN